MSPGQAQDDQPRSYLETWSLEFAPFAEQADSRFFYAGNALMQRLDLLTHLTQFGDSAVLVSGPPGSGKTTLLKRFTSQAISRWNLCLLDGRAFQQAAQQLAEALGGDSDTAPEALLDEWQMRTDPSQLLVIVVDNAGLLQEHDAEQLGRLLGSPWGERVRLILFGTAETEQVFDRTRQQGLFPDALQVLEMPRLSEEETSAYLMYRMAVAGYSGESPFSATEVRAICKAADGRPGEINRLAHEALLERQARAGHRPLSPTAGKSVGLAWVVAGAAVIAVLGYMGWQGYRERPSSPPSLADAGEPHLTTLPLQLPDPASLPLPADATGPMPAASTDAAGTPVAPPRDEVATAALVPGSLPAETAGAPETEAPGDTQTAADDSAPPEAETATPAVTPTAEPETAVAADTTPTEPETGAAVESAGTEGTGEDSATGPTSGAEQDAGPPTPGSAVDAPAALETTPAADNAASPPAAAPTKTGGPFREDWLLQQAPTDWTLQLLGSRSEKSVADFVRKHGLDQDQVAWYRGNYKGGDWYVVLYGIYPDRAAATAGRDALPAAIRKGKPWPRALKSVQQAIRDAASR